MHGLPTEKLTEKQLQITGGKHEIEMKLGRDNFVQKCREICSNNLLEMNKTFSSMGIALHNIWTNLKVYGWTLRMLIKV